MSLLAELKRRNVVRVCLAYVVIGWVLAQIAEFAFENFGAPDWALKTFIVLLLLGLPLALIFAWAFELTPEGLKREHEVDRDRSITHKTGRNLDYIIIGVLTMAVVWFAVEKFVFTAEESTTATDKIDHDKSIAVLPFVNMSDDPANEYFSEGISEELLNLLAKIPELRVIGRTSSFQFKGKQEDLRLIGQKLGVANILEGSVRKSGNTVRVSAQLVATTDGTHLWSDTFDRDLEDIFATQDEIANSVVATLKVKLLGHARLPRNAPIVTEAYDRYLKGLYFFRRSTPADLERALSLFAQAVVLDAELAPAWEKMGSVYLNQTLGGTLPLARGRSLSKEALERALELDPALADGHVQTGFLELAFDWDWSAAKAALNRALEIEPGHAGALSASGLLALAMGHLTDAIDFEKRSLRVDPLRFASRHNLALVYYRAGQNELALREFQWALEMAPDYERGHYYPSIVLLEQEKLEAALAEAKLEKVEQWRQAAFAVIYHALGRDDESGTALSNLTSGFADNAAIVIAQAHAYRSEIDQAFEWLDRAFEQHEPLVPFVKTDPLLNNLRSDPRFADFLERLDLAD